MPNQIQKYHFGFGIANLALGNDPASPMIKDKSRASLILTSFIIEVGVTARVSSWANTGLSLSYDTNLFGNMTTTYLTKERTESTSSGTIYVSKNNKLRNGNIMRVQGKYDIIISAGIS